MRDSPFLDDLPLRKIQYGDADTVIRLYATVPGTWADAPSSKIRLALADLLIRFAPTKERCWRAQCAISRCQRIAEHGGMDGVSSKLESLLQFLAEWEAERGTSFWGLMTADQLADVQELERMFALPGEE